MSRKPPRLILVAALAWVGLGPALAASPTPPPSPPPRPEFPDDEMLLRQSAEEAALAQAQAQAADAARAPWDPPRAQELAPQVQAYAPEAQTLPPPQAATQTATTVVPQGPANYPANYPAAKYPANYPAGTARQEENVPGFDLAEKTGLAELTRKYARHHGVPLALLHRIIMRESKYCPRLVNRRYYGLMQITPATARSMGYHGSAKGLLDPEINLSVGAPYLANAWALADGDMDRAVRLYASGYYYTAKSKGMISQLRNADSPPATPPEPTLAAPPPPPPPQNPFESLFRGSAQ